MNRRGNRRIYRDRWTRGPLGGVGLLGLLLGLGLLYSCGGGGGVRIYPAVAHVANAASKLNSQPGRLRDNGASTMGWSLYSVTVDPTGSYAYVANFSANTVLQYTIGANGTLTAMSPAPVSTGLFPVFVTVDPTGRYAYVANFGDNTVSAYEIGPTGALTPAAMVPVVATQNGPKAIAMTPKYAYVANFSANTVSQYTVGANGTLTAMGPASVAAGTGPYSVTVDPTSRYAYVANFSAYAYPVKHYIPHLLGCTQVPR